MQNLKNIAVGFLVSFVGSIPLGYLNVIGFQIYNKQGLFITLCYLLGVVFVEFFVIFSTLIFAERLARNEKLTKHINVFSIVFMFILAAVFYFGSKSESQVTEFSNFGYWGTFTTGIILSGLNFVQIPFWTGWNVYLLNKNFIEISKSRKYFYVFGTVFGTFAGMLLLILTLNYFIKNFAVLNENVISKTIGILFFAFGIFQVIKFYFKYKNPFKG